MLTYSDLLAAHLRGIGKNGSTDAVLITDFQINLGTRYQLALAKMTNYMTQIAKTASTTIDQQFYHNPVGLVNIETATIDLGTYTAPLEVINSQRNWDILNSIQIQASAVPQFIFPRRDDFGIWPTPQGVYVLTLNTHWKDRNLLVADYTTGTVSVAQNSQTVTGAGGATFTPAMVGRWFFVTSTTTPGEGYGYRITGYVSPTVITLETSWENASASGVTYRIGQVPEIPEEMHPILFQGTIADFFSGLRSDIAKATWWNNVFWTGDGNNSSRREGDPNIKGGLIGGMNLWGDRNNSRLINRRPKLNPLTYKVWGTQLT